MSIETLLASREEKRREATRVAWNQYHRLLADLHDAETIDPDEADAILAAAGKTDEDLARDAQTYAQRVQWSDAVARGTAAEAEAEAIRRRVEDLEAELAAVRERIGAQIAAANDQLARKRRIVLEANSAADALRESVLDPLAAEDAERIEAQRPALNERRRWLMNRDVIGDDEFRTEYNRVTAELRELDRRSEELQRAALNP